MWRCPLCKSPIELVNTPVNCPQNHSFDKAKSGYVNLFPVQFKKSKAPGDDKAMVQARRAFHQLNAYQPLKQRMVELALDTLKHSEKLKVKTPIHIFDAGCGEGSYLNEMVNGLCEKGISCVGAGSDISKIAVDLAAKAFKSEQFVVASSFDLPLENYSQDIMIQVFAPGNDAEYVRLLSDEGILITVDPSYDHLYEIKSLVYDSPRKHTPNHTNRDGLELVNRERLTFTIDLVDNEHALALIKMTPFYWKLPQGKISSMVNALKSVTADFNVQVWKKVL